MLARNNPDVREGRPNATAIQFIIAASGVFVWGSLLSAVLETDTTTWLVTLAVVEIVPLMLLGNHALAGFEGDRTSGRRWGWTLAASTWLPPLAVVIAYPYLERAGARRRPNAYGIITDPPGQPPELR